MKVKAHLHLPRLKSGAKECISVSPASQRKGDRTVYHGTIVLSKVTFKVSQAGRMRTLREGRKNVHAWVVGELVSSTPQRVHPGPEFWRVARYNPKSGPDFVDGFTNQPVQSAKAVCMVGPTVYYIPEDK